ncbi:hypothetical protein MVEN_00429100 [Mycena venus]|uniref:Uncharacterized protein n=1 Tax=Mycena venus TaxID=2733690 RepID=A0A8H6YSN0_9AGAR|nr:hypothetical protein MVEN_00429100 [Mycena venus]
MDRTGRKASYPLPTIRSARPASPEPFDPEDENLFVDREIPYEQETLNGVPIEETEQLQNPVTPQGGQATTGNSPFLTPSTARSMVGQTMRSFESRPGTTTRAKATADTATALSRTGSSSTIVTFDDVAPSELEIYTQSGLLPPTKGEKVAAHRIRGDENEVRIAAILVAVQRRIGELEKKLNAQHGEVLIRIDDIIKTSPTTSTGSLASTVTTELARVKAMTMEGRSAISNLTEAVNSLIDLPRDITRLSRTVQNMTRNEGTRSAQAASHNKSTEDDDFPLASDTMPDNSAPSTSIKRARPFAGFNDPAETKRQKSDEPSHTDVYLWNVDIDKASPMSIARRAMDELKMRDYMANIISVAHPRNTPKTVISIRFRCIAIAEEFIDRLRANPPATMAKLHAAKRDVYEKKAMGASDKGNLPW